MNGRKILCPGINCGMYSELIFYIGAKTIKWKPQSFEQMVLACLDMHMQKNEVKPLPYKIYKS